MAIEGLFPAVVRRRVWSGWLAVAWLLIVTSARAQLGDAPGERQEPIVPPEQIPSASALEPQEALRSFTIAAGYRLELVASEPLVQDPVAMAFGPDGRMWVVEMRGFMPNLDGVGEDAPVGRVVVLRDRDGDGRFDESKVFVDGLVLPRTVLPVAGGVLVGAPPELAWWQDTDGDGRADQKRVLATDYGVKVDPSRPYFANPELAPNALLWGLDNWIYSAAYTRKFRYARGEWESAPTGFRGQWGLSQDDYGRLYHNSNSDQLRVDLIAPEYLQRHPHAAQLEGANVAATTDQQVWPGRVTPGVNRGYRPDVLREGRLWKFTAACAPWIYRGDLLPELAGSAFVAEPAANLVRRNLLTAADGMVTARNAHDRAEFLTSTDERFRPVNFATGPDGALYIVDLYRGVLQHRLSLTSYLRRQSATRGLVEPRHLGRIYRVVPARVTAPERATLAMTSSADWVAQLGHANAWWREAAQQVLVERGEPAVAPAVRDLLRKGPARARTHALWTLHGLQALTATDALAALDDVEPAVRAAAWRLSETFLAGPDRPRILPRLLARADDRAPEVRLQALLTLGEARDPAADDVLAAIVAAHPTQPLLIDAVLSGSAGRELRLLERLCTEHQRGDRSSRARIAGDRLAAGLAALVLASRDPAAIQRALELGAAHVGADARGLAVLDGLIEAAADQRRPIMLPQKPDAWAKLAENPDAARRVTALDKKLLWPGKPGAETALPPPLSPQQQEWFNAGRGIYAGVCAACHQTTGRGLEGLAPPLLDSEWVLGSEQRLIRVLLHGLSGPIKVRRRQYTGDMPAFGQALNDTQLASVLTYIRREWGHDGAVVTPARVAAERAATAGHSGAWSQEELRATNLSPAARPK